MCKDWTVNKCLLLPYPLLVLLISSSSIALYSEQAICRLSTGSGSTFVRW